MDDLVTFHSAGHEESLSQTATIDRYVCIGKYLRDQSRQKRPCNRVIITKGIQALKMMSY